MCQPGSLSLCVHHGLSGLSLKKDRTKGEVVKSAFDDCCGVCWENADDYQGQTNCPYIIFSSDIKSKSVLLNNHYEIQTLAQTKQYKCHTACKIRAGRERGGGARTEQKAGGMVANKGGSERGRKTGRYAKGFSMFNFQIGLSRMTFS